MGGGVEGREKGKRLERTAAKQVQQVHDPRMMVRGLTLERLLKQNARSLRMEGSSALELCSVAVGRLDAFYEVPQALHVAPVCT